MAPERNDQTPSKAESSETRPKVSLLGNDKVVIEFRIDDLIKQLRIDLDRRGPVEACGGCDSCSK